MTPEQRITELGLHLPPPLVPPAGVRLPFPEVRVRGDRAYVSGHGPLNPDWTVMGPAGKVGATVTPEEANAASRAVALIMLGDLRRTLGSLDRITAWLKVFGMVNCAPGFTGCPGVINGFSDVILDVWGAEAGSHARSAIGVAELPFDIPVEIEAEVEISR